ncbi:hypothetical protein ACFL1I_01060 [Candidatus Omnitrophota bacterium]
MIAKRKKGFVLITAYMVIVVLVILGAAFISRAINETRIAQRQNRSAKALYLAEAGIDFALTQLRAGNPAGNNNAFLAQLGNYNCVWNRIGFTLTWEIVSTGTVDNIQRIVRVELQPDTFARYLYFTDDEHFRWNWWRLPVWFISGDYLGGPLQSNSHLHISGDPVFADPNYHNAVKTVGDTIDYMHGGPPNDNPDFQEGIQLGVDPVPFPSQALDLRSAAANGGYEFNASGVNPAQIILHCDSTITVTDQVRVSQNMALPANGAVFVAGGDVQVSGALSGQLSIGGDSNIVVTDNVAYCDDPRINPESADTLALIAERDVVVSSAAPYDLEINASILALGSSFVVEEWWEGPAKGTLTVYGGIIQDERGPVGTFDSDTNTRMSGYSKNYQYDFRLLEDPPPFYPTTGDFVILLWEEL